MNEEENVATDNSNQYEEADLNTANENESNDSESVEEMKARLAKAEELANNYKIRAEKAERLSKNSKESPIVKKQSSTAGEVSTQDLYALIEAKVPQEDIIEVQEYAQLKGISLSEALKSNVVKTILSDKAEMRNTASAANVGSGKRGSAKVSDEVLIANLKKGIMPESDEDITRLVQARNKK